MDEFDSDLEQARSLRERKKIERERQFSKLLNKKDLNSVEMDQMFLDLE